MDESPELSVLTQTRRLAFVGSVLLVLVGWCLATGLVNMRDPAPLSIGTVHGQLEVTAVGPGEEAWLSGVRPGDRVAALAPPGDARSWDTALVEVGGGATLDIGRTEFVSQDPVLLAAPLALLLLALVAWPGGTLSVAALVLAASLDASASAWLVRPAALLVWLTPALVAGLGFVRLRYRAAAVFALGGLFVAWIGGLAGLLDWRALYLAAPVVSGALVAWRGAHTLGDGLARARRRRAAYFELGVPATWRSTLLEELVPGRALVPRVASTLERRRLASSLHREVLPEIDRARAALAHADLASQATSALDRASAQLRQVMNDRHPIELEALGFVEAIEELAERVQRDGGPEVRVQISTDVDAAPRFVELTAFEAVREALANVRHHAAAHLVTIDVVHAPDRLEVSVSDDGVGVRGASIEQALRSGHRGLAELEANARALGARAEVHARTGGGTTMEWRWTASPSA